MGDDKEDNHKLSPFLRGCIGKTCINNCFTQEALSLSKITMHLNIKYIFHQIFHHREVTSKGQEEQEENYRAKPNFAGLIPMD